MNNTNTDYILKDYCSACKTKENLLPKPYTFGSGLSKLNRRIGYRLCNRCNTIRLKKYRATEQGAKNTYKANKRQTIINKSHVSARAKVKDALEKGIISKPLLCSSCQDVKKLDAHHHDYGLPLDIIWLCRQCHSLLHRTLR